MPKALSSLWQTRICNALVMQVKCLRLCTVRLQSTNRLDLKDTRRNSPIIKHEKRSYIQTNGDWLSVYSCNAVTAATSIMAARARHVRKCLLSPSQDGQCPTRSAEQDHGRLYWLNWALRVLEGCNKEGERGRHVRTCAAWLCLVCQASRPRRTLRSSAAVNVSIQAVFEPSLSSFCDFPTSPYLPVLPSDPGGAAICVANTVSGALRRKDPENCPIRRYVYRSDVFFPELR